MATTLLKIFLPTVLVLGILQSIGAEPHPDFALKATISGTSTVVKYSNSLAASLDVVDNADVSLTGGYSLLENMKAAIVFIAKQVTLKGTAFTSAFNTLAPDRSNDITAAFAPVYTAIDAFRTLLQSGFTAQFAVLQTQGNFITDQLKDAFKTMVADLNLFSSALDRMKTAVTSAKAAPGNPPNGISAENMSRFIGPRLVGDLRETLSRLDTDIPLVTYIVAETQRKLEMADDFLGEMVVEAKLQLAEIASARTGLDVDAATAIGENIAKSFTDLVSPVYSAQIGQIADNQAVIEAISTFNDDLKPALLSLKSLLDTPAITSLTTTIKGAFSTYIAGLDNSDASSASIEQFLFTETCQGLRSVIGALVANSPYSLFCFSKFSPILFNQFTLTYYSLSECYQIEMMRLQRLQDLMALIVEMIIYDLEDLGEAITSCAPLNDGAPCLTLIGPMYEILASTIDEKQSYILNFIEEETIFSQQRVGLCVTTTKYTTVIAIAALIANQQTCSTNGPSA